MVLIELLQYFKQLYNNVSVSNLIFYYVITLHMVDFRLYMEREKEKERQRQRKERERM